MIRSLVIFLALLAPLTATAGTSSLQSAQRMIAQDRLPQALQTLDHILSSQPRNVQARFLKGIILARQGHTAEAIRVYTALSQDNPKLPEPHNNLAALYADAGQYNKARAELEAALRTSSNYDTAYQNLSKIYAKLATLAYDKALRLGGENQKTRHNQLRLALIDDLPSKQPSLARATPVTPIAPTIITSIKKAASLPAPQSPLPIAAKKRKDHTPTLAKKTVAKKTHEKIVPELARAEAVVNTVKAWARAWSAQDINAYFSFYGKHFPPPHGQNRHRWEKVRRYRIKAPKTITVRLTAIRVTFRDNAHAVVTFRQHYHANTFTGTATKTLTLTHQGKQWLIEDEHIRR